MERRIDKRHLLTDTWRRLKQFDGVVLLREFLKHPGAVGAVWPSSRVLAQTIAKQVPIHGEGLIIELGAGTGAVTTALLAAGIRPERILIVERSARFVNYLRRHFPAIQVIQGDAAKLQNYVPDKAVVDTIVSSLPLRSLDSSVVDAVIEQWHSVLTSTGIVIQYTYTLHRLTDHLRRRFYEQTNCLVWRNIPPARVSRLIRYNQI